MVDLDQYLKHTQAPARALEALKWMNKNADQELDLSNLQVPTTPRAIGQRGQAPVVEPPLLQALEDRSVELHAVGDERWSVLLAPWVMAYGCLRYAHIARSEPRRLTAAFLHCRCPKGKQKHAREGFDFAVPAYFSNGFFWAKEVLEAHRTLAPARQRVAGLCFSDEGRPWTILEVQETMQNEMAVFLDNPEEILLASHGANTGTVAGVPPRRDGRFGGLAEQGRSTGCGPNGLPLFISEICGLDQDQVSGMGRGIQVDGPTVLGGDPTGRLGPSSQSWSGRGGEITSAGPPAVPGRAETPEAVATVHGGGRESQARGRRRGITANA